MNPRLSDWEKALLRELDAVRTRLQRLEAVESRFDSLARVVDSLELLAARTDQRLLSMARRVSVLEDTLAARRSEKGVLRDEVFVPVWALDAVLEGDPLDLSPEASARRASARRALRCILRDATS